MSDDWNYLSPEEMTKYERVMARQAAEDAAAEEAAKPAPSPFPPDVPIKDFLRGRVAAGYAEGKTEDELLAETAGLLFQAAAAGDARVLNPGPGSY